MKKALIETVEMIGFDLTQELKVTNLRMLNFMKNQLLIRQKTEMLALNGIDESLVPSPYEPQDADLLTFAPPFEDPSKFGAVNRLFKNPKAFFEKGERDVLREKLEELLKHDSSLYLGQQREHIERWTDRWIESEAEGLRQHLLKESVNQIESERVSLSGTVNLDEWRSVFTKLQK